MIVFLTLIYVALLFLLVKIGIIKLTLFWKISPAIWMLLLFICLFVPMQWGAPSGKVNVYQTVVEIVPNVSGEVIEVPVDGLKSIKQGDVLFVIDPVPFQNQVDLLESQLVNAEQSVKELAAEAEAAEAVVTRTEQEIGILDKQLDTARTGVVIAEATVRESLVQKTRIETRISDLEKELEPARREYERVSDLLSRNAIPQSEFDKVELSFTELSSQLNTTRIDGDAIEETINKARSSLEVARNEVTTLELQMVQLTDAELPRVKALARQASLAANAMIGNEHTAVASVRAQLETARYNLAQTTVRAPADGYAVGVSLRPGQRVTSMPLRSFLSFVNSEQTRIAVGIDQYTMRFVEPGQPAEVTFSLYPGRIFNATVEKVSTVTSEGQLAPSGLVPEAPKGDEPGLPFGVILKLDPDSEIDVTTLPGGAVGSAAIYTSKNKPTHVIRKVMIRMDAWLNYLRS